MLYTDLVFTGEQIFKERARVQRDGLISAAFGAWQNLSAQSEKFPGWNEYLDKLGLVKKPKLTKEDLEREADEAMRKVQQLINRGRNGSR